jgi:ketosteroid isomerase-like protein
MSQENVEIVRRGSEVFLAAVERGDPGAVFDMDALADDAEWVVPRFPNPEPTLVLRGREEFVEWFRTWTEDFEDWSARIERVIDAGGDRVAVLTHQSATGAASGVPVELDTGVVGAERRTHDSGDPLWLLSRHPRSRRAAGVIL